MKNILITGADSFVGGAFEKWLSQWPDDYSINTVDTHNDYWKNIDFSKYDTVFHVAGIAHSDTNKVTAETKQLYYKINRDLAIEIATIAKRSGVRQFIFMSSIIVYGESSNMNEKKVISTDTVPMPSNFYGDSKLQAEIGLNKLQDEHFHVAIIRSPMIYGEECKGNYPVLAKFAIKTPVFPNISNQRSMIYIRNLCEFLRYVINEQLCGILFPQNSEYVKTSELVRSIAEVHGRKIMLTKLFNPVIRLAGIRVKFVSKAFGNIVYDKSISLHDKYQYNIYFFEDSIRITENAGI